MYHKITQYVTREQGIVLTYLTDNSQNIRCDSQHCMAKAETKPGSA